VLQDGDMAALFGLEMADGESSQASASAKPRQPRRARKPPAVKKQAARSPATKRQAKVTR